MTPTRMTDDEVNDYVYQRIFGDMDKIEAENLFDHDDTGIGSETADKAEPATESTGGISITVTPLMKGAEEGGRKTDLNRDGEEKDDEDEEDKLSGIGRMSPLMSQLHGSR